MWFLATPAFAIPDESTQWTDVLQSANPRIECATVGTEPWCRSIGLVALPIEKVAATLENMAAHQELFESIVSIRVLTPDTMHITLDYPFPLWDRDYVAKYTRSNDGGVWRYRWEAVTNAAAPPVKGVVRLPRMAGEWKLEPSGGQTQVTYLWQAEVTGVPAAAARKIAGNEAIKDITKASKAASAP
jgi:hypothetical protein